MRASVSGSLATVGPLRGTFRYFATMTSARPAYASQWPREESNLRTQIRSLPLYPLSYGAG